MSRIPTLAAAGTALFLLGGCVTNPETGSRGMALVPDSVMASLGAESYAQVKASEPISTDPRKNDIVERVAARITAATDVQEDWEVTLIDSPEANAFVLPGGKIVVYTGILPICQTEAGLAFVLGHEVGHELAKHGNQRVSQNLLVQGGLSVADLSLGDSSQKGLIMGALGAGAQYGVLLPYSRGHESDADHTGLRLMARAGYDPRVAPGLWQRMAAAGGEQPPEFMSTHPSHESRIAQLEALMPEAMTIYERARPQYGLGASF